MEERKRRIASPVAESGSVAQKRKLSLLNDGSSSSTSLSPGGRGRAGAGGQEEEGEDEANEEIGLDASLGLKDGFLDTFRKEALYRQMQEYKREYTRIASKADKLQDDWKASQLRLREVEQCWVELVSEIRTVIGDASTEASSNGLSDDAASFSARVQEAKDLISRLARTSLQNSSGTPSDLAHRYDVISAQLIESRSSHSLLQDVLKQTQEELERTQELLRVAERKSDREQSDSVKTLEAKEAYANSKKNKAKQDATGGALANNDSVNKASPAPASANTPNAGTPKAESGNQEQDIKPEVQALIDSIKDDQQEGSSGLSRSEIEHLQSLAQARLKETEELRAEKAAIQSQLEELRITIHHLPEKTIAANTYFVGLKTSLEALQASYDRLEQQNETLSQESTALKEALNLLKVDIEKELQEQNEELSTKLHSSTTDLVRVREHRDRLHHQMELLRTRDTEKWKCVDQMRKLAESRQNRINALASEVQRLRLKLAAKAGDSELLELRATTASATTEPVDSKEPDDSSAQPLPEEALVASLRAQVQENEKYLANYRQRLAELTGLSADEAANDDLDMAEKLLRGEADAKAQLEDLQAKHARLVELLDAEGKVDGEAVRSKYEAALETIKRLETQLKEQSLSSEMLIGEIATLSDAWNALNEQVNSKVLDLRNQEIRYEKLAADRFKHQTRSYTAGQEKEGALSQAKKGETVIARQAAVLNARAEEMEQLKGINRNLEQQATEYTKSITVYTKRIADLEKEIQLAQAEQERARAIDSKLGHAIEEKNSLIASEEYKRKRQDEKIAKLEKDVERWKGKAQDLTAVVQGQGKMVESNDLKETQEYAANLEKLLKCGTCRIRFKSVVITRCYHVFCKECIDIRIETRQRKCPTCGLGFGATDVQQIYLN